MFEMLRKMILPIIITVLVFFVAMIVLEWGMNFSGRGTGLERNVAGIINGEEISWQTYSQVLNNLYQNERNTRGADYEIPETRERELEQQAWDELVADRLIKQEGQKMGVVVTGEDLYQFLRFNPPQFLQQSPELQTNGVFDYQKYEALMADPSQAAFWASVEQAYREDLKRFKVQQQVMEAAVVSDEEARQAFLDHFEKITLGVVNIPMTRFYGLIKDPTPEEMQEYYEKNREDYKLGERVVLEIVRASKAPGQFDEEAAKVRAQEIYDSVTAGSDFAEFARIYSDDPGSGSNGGDLGWFAPGRMVKQFDSAAFAMREGEISLPIKTDFGWHVLKHMGYREENGQREAHVAHILVKTEASTQTLDAAWQQLDLIKTQAAETGFAEAAQAEGLEVHTTTPPLEKTGSVSWVGAGPKDIEWAFKAQVGDISEVLDLTNYYCVMRVADKIPAGVAELKDVEARVKRDFRNAKLAEVCRDTAQVIYDEIGRGATLENAAIRYGFTYEKLEPISRDASVPKLGGDPTAIGTAFSLKNVGAVSKPVDYSTGTVIMELLNRESPDLTTFSEKRDSVLNVLKQTKQQRAWGAWYTSVVENAQIENYLNFQRRR
ncbi:MAG: peptidylprolyl isomerase [Candidatus Zixiibacteriota bacterium]